MIKAFIFKCSNAHLDILISKFSPTPDFFKKHLKILHKLPKTPKIHQKLQFFGPNFLAFFAILRPIMTQTGFPMFSKPPIESLNLHYYL